MGGSMNQGMAMQNPFDPQFRSEHGQFNNISNQAFLQFNAQNQAQGYNNMYNQQMGMLNGLNNSQATMNSQQTINPYFGGMPNMTQSNPNFMGQSFNQQQQAQMQMYQSYGNMMGSGMGMYYSNPQFIDGRARANATLHPGFDKNQTVKEKPKKEKKGGKPLPTKRKRMSVSKSSSESEQSDADGEEEEELLSPAKIGNSQLSSGYNPRSGFGMYRNDDKYETHSMVDQRNSGTFSLQMSGFGNKAKSGFEGLNLGASEFYMEQENVIQEATTEGKSGGGSSMNISDVKGLQGILEDQSGEQSTTNLSNQSTHQSANLPDTITSNKYDCEDDNLEEEDVDEAFIFANEKIDGRKQSETDYNIYSNTGQEEHKIRYTGQFTEINDDESDD